jgi:competence protein ComEC
MAAHFINVGQGQAVLLEFSCGLVLVDTGGGDSSRANWTRRFTNYLDRVFARRTDLTNRTMDVVFLTHPHIDHTRGATELGAGSRYRIGGLVTDTESTGSGIEQQNDLIEYARQRQLPLVGVQTSMIVSTQGLTDSVIDPVNCAGTDPDIRVLWGSFDQPRTWVDNENNHSVVVRVGFGESSFLIVGDLEDAPQRAMVRRYAGNPDALNVDIYAVGHHASRNGTTRELMRAMSPEMGVISSGNPADRETGYSAYQHGHPNLVAINLLRNATDGVSMARPARTFPVGVSGGVRARPPRPARDPVYRDETIDRAIFGTGWDGNIVIFAHKDGGKRVLVD